GPTSTTVPDERFVPPAAFLASTAARALSLPLRATRLLAAFVSFTRTFLVVPARIVKLALPTLTVRALVFFLVREILPEQSPPPAGQLSDTAARPERETEAECAAKPT